ncbi:MULTISPECIES: NAD-dependent succinate-semialdehyde dehydrogenase [Bartonella]|uniref:NAD-dependent succinate-semialdehyde dehydrogenase n=1 Tax=Bartonella TaxID=773 RepID=UPI0018DD11C8|nr:MULTISPECIES: NAD-dependent succinate-semialdehyde dehydrogenase [Bartonella]MBH9994228.1 NAD-dependent succinate-semialdehyde dehydrogenase [Bartonella sp. P0291]MBH9997427.1 NAD-dependent succinate-semialdehyde dehydrogenase [Bartonella sp. M0192]MBH9999587.1 NAD-dependent succinate-semialdehyde dehydrogenase [Bartonella sp. M0191]MBI0008521.1 NAD-dependent succinate-semialdehyde dehydrogenase [Bartonella sp. M0193]MBI0010878.1 NAD-dependent succinate-semialdehyde dehydrogenase [Bartonell
MSKKNYPDTKLLINGEWVDGGDQSIAVVNPATEEVVGHVAHATTAQLEQAAQSIAKGFHIWKNVSVFDRSKIMHKAATLLRERADEIAWLLTCEQGKILKEAKIETLGAADTIDWFAEEARRTYGQIIPARADNVTQMVIKRPVGPVAAFTPWNFPINQVVRKLSAALAAGCSIVIKAPEETPASPAALVQCFIDAGVPSGVMALVFGVPAEISEFLIPHPVIEKISFTGSTVIGKHLAAIAGKHMKKATMELGGHAPVLVFDDADVDKAISIMAASKFRNAGQVCASPTRFIVQDKVYENFLDGFTKVARSLKVGDGLNEENSMGPLANERRIPAMEKMIADAISKGAKLVCGGKRIGNKGYFFEPTILANVSVDAKIMNEEPFGPVAIINRYNSDDDMINEANRLRYGLASFAFTKSTARVQALSSLIDAGMTSINHNGLALPEVPFGGIRDSGYGTEGGSEAINAYLDLKFVTLAS